MSAENKWQPVRIAPFDDMDHADPSKNLPRMMRKLNEGKIIHVREYPLQKDWLCGTSRNFISFPGEFPGEYPEQVLFCEHQILAD